MSELFSLNYQHILILIFSLLISVITGIMLIPVLRKIKFGQTVRHDGPKTHLKKMGIPTMGGIIFIVPVLAISIAYSAVMPKILPLVFSTAAFGLIGFLDDYIKVVKKRKDGLYPKQKTLLQILIGAAFAIYIVYFNIIDNVILFPNYELYIPKIILIAFIILILYATTNAVNLTDGIDGLNTSVTIIVLTGFLTLAFANPESEYVKLFCLSLIGGCLGFLLFNKYPASVIMGDTGSLALGGAVGALTVYFKSPIVILFFGIIYIVETLSVIIQVTSFRLRGKRVFKMSPLHHHFELCGWRETKIVKVFVLITLFFCILGVLLYYLSII